MLFEPTPLADVLLVRPERRSDERGYFVRAFCEDEFRAHGLESRFPQTSLSFNAQRGTVRGMHFQRQPNAETKLVRCSRGAIFDVLIDLRPESSTYLQWCGFELTASNGFAVYIPEGYAHGFQTLEDATEVTYAITPPYTPGVAAGVRWNDPALDVHWPLEISMIAPQDQSWPLIGGAA